MTRLRYFSLTGVVTLVATLLSPAAFADWYGAFRIGFQDGRASDLDGIDTTVSYSFRSKVPSIAVGRRVGETWRVELEAVQLRTNAELLSIGPSGQHIDPDARDNTDARGYGINILRDFRTNTVVEPFVGLGLGLAKIDMRVGETNDVGPGDLFVDDSDSAWYYQLSAGVSVALTERVDLSLAYRYWRAPSVSLKSVDDTPIDTDYAVDALWFEARYQMGSDAANRVTHASTQDLRGWHFSASLGATRAQDVVSETPLAETGLDAMVVGASSTISVGFATSDHWHFDLEASRGQNRVRVVDFGWLVGERRSSGHGRWDSLLMTANYRFRPDASIRPTLGFGYGRAEVRYDVDLSSPSRPLLDDQARGSAYQLAFGLEAAVSQKLTLTARYRIQKFVDLNMTLEDGTPFDTDLEVHTANIGFRWTWAG